MAGKECLNGGALVKSAPLRGWAAIGALVGLLFAFLRETNQFPSLIKESTVSNDLQR